MPRHSCTLLIPESKAYNSWIPTNLSASTSMARRLGLCSLCSCVLLFLAVARVLAQDEPRLSNERVVFQASACDQLRLCGDQGRCSSLSNPVDARDPYPFFNQVSAIQRCAFVVPLIVMLLLPTLQTDFGDIEFAFFPDVAPVTTAHIALLCRLACYTTNHFFRVSHASRSPALLRNVPCAPSIWR